MWQNPHRMVTIFPMHVTTIHHIQQAYYTTKSVQGNHFFLFYRNNVDILRQNFRLRGHDLGDLNRILDL